MSAPALIERLRARGVKLYLDDTGEKVRFSPKSLVGADEVDELRVLKPKIIPLLAVDNTFEAVTTVELSPDGQKSCKSGFFEGDNSVNDAVTPPPSAVTREREGEAGDSTYGPGDSAFSDAVTRASGIDKPNSGPGDSGDGADSPKTPNFVRRERENASQLGLVAKWSRRFGYISIHDPTSGEWYDLATEDAPGWAVREAFRRKDLWRSGNRRAYQLTAREMDDVWESEQVEMWEELHRPVDAREGLVYDTDGQED